MKRPWGAIAVGVVAILLVVAALRFVPRVRQTSATLPSARIAVLRFDAPGDTVLADYRNQLAELLVATVGRGQLDRVAIMGPSFTSRFAGTTTPPDSIRDGIGATHVLSGTVRIDDGIVRVFAQLIRTNDRRHLWAARFSDSCAAAHGAPPGSRIGSIADSIARATTNLATRDR